MNDVKICHIWKPSCRMYWIRAGRGSFCVTHIALTSLEGLTAI